ncbi:hypothetical protein [Mariniflexile sp. HMF6888]|uniref:hypothetical protein n=1 Tax=Mariniflexile sp. HMF6888 TaxID=3373086 RepID=UPI00379FE1C5
MKKNILVLTLLLLTISSCKDDDDNLSNSCQVSNPIEDLDWLKEKIEELAQTDSELLKYFYISQNTYMGKTVFIFPNCCPTCNTVVPVYDCEGNPIGFVGDDTISINILNNDTIIWNPENFSCN